MRNSVGFGPGVEGLVSVLVILCSANVQAHACSMKGCSDRGIEVTPNFVVGITHNGKPLVGVAVKISELKVSGDQDGEKTQSWSVVTAHDGIARLRNIPPGDYWMTAELLGITAGSECFHILSQFTHKAKGRLEYHWGDDAPATRRIVGTLIDSQKGQSDSPLWNLTHRTDVPITYANLTLLNPLDPLNPLVASTSSDSSGSFMFSDVPAGTYVLHVYGGRAGGSDYEGSDTVLQVQRNAPADSLLLKHRDAGGGSCGGTSVELARIQP